MTPSTGNPQDPSSSAPCLGWAGGPDGAGAGLPERREHPSLGESVQAELPGQEVAGPGGELAARPLPRAGLVPQASPGQELGRSCRALPGPGEHVMPTARLAGKGPC